MIIAFDGASTDLSVALLAHDGTVIAEDAWSSGHRQSAELLPRLLATIEGSDRTLPDATAIAVGLGPGSFTGLRVAVALGKGLAMGLGLPIVGVPSLVAWLASDAQASAAVARAGARDAFVARRDDPDIAIVDRDALIGIGNVVTPAELVAAFGLLDSRPPRAAATIARMAASRLAADGSGDDLSALEPIYLRAPRGITAESTGVVRWL
ncbi:MAG: tRNA (adenosine(37)-N6)-threonylcarbamoyltransferase complex dimerization subunit type 1 TsaB [Candidatus Limnocylindria bacterium]